MRQTATSAPSARLHEHRFPDRTPTAAPAQLLEFAPSAYEYMNIGTLANLARLMQQHPEALRYFPPGTSMIISAAKYSVDDRFDVGYYCQLRITTPDESYTTAETNFGRRSEFGVTIESQFSRFLAQLSASAQLSRDD